MTLVHVLRVSCEEDHNSPRGLSCWFKAMHLIQNSTFLKKVKPLPITIDRIYHAHNSYRRDTAELLCGFFFSLMTQIPSNFIDIIISIHTLNPYSL